MIEKRPFSFAKTFAFTAIMFVIVVTLIEALFSLFTKAGFNGFLQNFDYPLIIKYAVAKLIGGVIYGLFMTFILKKKAEKLVEK